MSEQLHTTDPLAVPDANAVPGATPDSPVSQLPLILVGIDGSDDGMRAARFAARSAGTTGRVHLFHAVDDAVLAGAWGVIYDPSLLQEAGEKAIDAAVQAVLDTGLSSDRVTSEVVLGNASAELVRRSKDAALLVLGRRSVNGLERMFVGSTSVATAAASHCPTIVVSQASSPQPTGAHGLVVVGLDAARSSETTLRWAAEQAHSRGARLEVVHEVEPGRRGLFGRGHAAPEVVDAQVQAAQEGLRAMVDAVRADFPDLPITIEVGAASPVDALVARSGHADLLVVGIATNGVTRQVGGTVRGLMAHSQAPIALVPAPSRP